MREVNINKFPVPVAVSKFKADLTNLIFQYQQKGLPSFMIEGAMSSILVEIVKAAASETEAGYAEIIESLQKAANESEEESKESEE